MEYAVLLIIHVLLAMIIIGGSLLGSFYVLPSARKTDNPDLAFGYEKAYRKGFHAILTVQFLVGFRLGMIYLPMGEWFTFASSMSITLVAKLLLWVLMFAWIIIGKRMKLNDPETGDLSSLSRYFTVLTVLSLAMLFFGLNVRLALV